MPCARWRAAGQPELAGPHNGFCIPKFPMKLMKRLFILIAFASVLSLPLSALPADGKKTSAAAAYSTKDAPVLQVDVFSDQVKNATAICFDDQGVHTTTDIFPVTMSNDAPDIFPIGDSIITYTATDSNGNTSIATQSITIEGNTPITFTGEWMANNVLDIRFTQDATPYLERSDFTVSSGEILGFYTWYQMDNRLIFLMENIPENEILTVTYVGDGLDIGDYTLYNGEKLVTSPNPR